MDFVNDLNCVIDIHVHMTSIMLWFWLLVGLYGNVMF